MNSTDDQQPSTPELNAPLNRAARRAKNKGKGASGQAPGPSKNDRLRGSQIMAQPKLKGKRGDR